jgi:DNA-binding XRE family transcriptional regulator
MQLVPGSQRYIAHIMRVDCRAFAAKLRMARALLDWSQSELALRIGLTQRGVHILEKGETEPRRTTMRAIEMVWHHEGIEFEDMPGGGFRLTVASSTFNHRSAPRRRPGAASRLGSATHTRRAPTHRG